MRSRVATSHPVLTLAPVPRGRSPCRRLLLPGPRPWDRPPAALPRRHRSHPPSPRALTRCCCCRPPTRARRRRFAWVIPVRRHPRRSSRPSPTSWTRCFLWTEPRLDTEIQPCRTSGQAGHGRQGGARAWAQAWARPGGGGMGGAPGPPPVEVLQRLQVGRLRSHGARRPRSGGPVPGGCSQHRYAIPDGAAGPRQLRRRGWAFVASGFLDGPSRACPCLTDVSPWASRLHPLGRGLVFPARHLRRSAPAVVGAAALSDHAISRRSPDACRLVWLERPRRLRRGSLWPLRRRLTASREPRCWASYADQRTAGTMRTSRTGATDWVRTTRSRMGLRFATRLFGLVAPSRDAGPVFRPTVSPASRRIPPAGQTPREGHACKRSERWPGSPGLGQVAGDGYAWAKTRAPG